MCSESRQGPEASWREGKRAKTFSSAYNENNIIGLAELGRIPSPIQAGLGRSEGPVAKEAPYLMGGDIPPESRQGRGASCVSCSGEEFLGDETDSNTVSEFTPMREMQGDDKRAVPPLGSIRDQEAGFWFATPPEVPDTNKYCFQILETSALVRLEKAQSPESQIESDKQLHEFKLEWHRIIHDAEREASSPRTQAELHKGHVLRTRCRDFFYTMDPQCLFGEVFKPPQLESISCQYF